MSKKAGIKIAEDKLLIQLAKVGWTKTEFARICKINLKTLYDAQNLESRKILSPKCAKKMMDALNCEFEDIFFVSNYHLNDNIGAGNDRC